MISKKLFSKIIGIDEKFIEYITIEGNKIICKIYCTPNELHKTEFNKHLQNDYYNTKQNFYKELNVFEFVFEIKKWAYDYQGYILNSSFCNKNKSICYISLLNKEFFGNTEIEAIIEAGNYIVNQL